MKFPRPNKNHGWTLTEAIVVVATVAVLAGLAYLMLHRTKIVPHNPRDERTFKVRCVNNQKQIVLAFKIWANDNGDKYPQQISEEKGGAMNEAGRGNLVPIFQIMSNELWKPVILACPADSQRKPANDFKSLDKSHISYFVNLSASEEQPASVFIGDANLSVSRKSAKSGSFEFSSDAAISWTPERHRDAGDVGTGNIGLADGSVQYTTPEKLRKIFANSGVANNRLIIP